MSLAGLACIIAAGLLQPAWAGPDDKATRKPHRPDNFWEWLIDPHGAEILVILEKAEKNRTRAISDYPIYDYPGYSEPNRRIRDKMLADALGMLKYALELEPDHIEVKRELAYVADDAGRIDTAQKALEDYLKSELSERIQPEARWRLGHLFAKRRDWNQAVVELRLALGERGLSQMHRSQTLRCLASVYMHTGRMAEAIDLLAYSHKPDRYGWSLPDSLVQFTLAVAYDRDEQVTRAHEVLDKLMHQQNRYVAGTSIIQIFTSSPHSGPMLYVPPNDQHYFHALLYEVAGQLPEARTEWLAYARGGSEAPFRRRALAHVESIDELLSAPLRKGKAKKKRRRRRP